MIFAVDDRPVAQDIDFFVEMMEKKAGEDVTLVVMRDGKRHRFVVQLTARPDGTQQAWRNLGMRLREISPEQAARLRLSSSEALLIYEVHEAGAAYEAGIEPGDILLQIGRVAAKDLQSVADALDSVKAGQPIDLRILRVQQSRFGTRMETYNVQLKAR